MNNIFILGPVASGKNTLLDNIVENHDVIALDTGRIFRYIAYQLYNKFNGEINFEKICKNDEKEMELLIEKIYHSTKYIETQLRKLKFNGYKMIAEDNDINIECLYEKNVNCILPIISKISTIRNLVVRYIDYSISLFNKPVVMTGHNIKEIDTTKFTIVFLDVDEKESAYRLYQRNKNSYDSILDAYEEVLKRNQTDKIKETRSILPFLYNYIYINTDNKDRNEIYEEFICKLKNNEEKNNHFYSVQCNAINRDDFDWIFNPILEPIKKRLIEFTNTICLNYPYINQNDLVYQTLILISSHNIFELYSNCDLRYLSKIEESIINREKELYKDFTEKVDCGIIKINENILHEELKSAMIFLLNLYSTDSIKDVMTRYNLKTSKGTLEHRNGLMIINGEESKNVLTFKEIDHKMSNYLSKYCHYLHTPRSDELISYGAFVEDNSYPIAFVSFSKQDRDYKKQLLYNLGIEPQNSVEMTRAWCSNSAPQNVMSSLFQYSIKELTRKWKEESRLNLVDKELQAITTTINPNLGFKASSFFGCNFIPIALRPAQFTFKLNNGITTYETRRKIESSSSIDDLYFENQIKVLPLNELILCLNKNKTEDIMNSKILLIDKESYESALSGKKIIRKKEF